MDFTFTPKERKDIYLKIEKYMKEHSTIISGHIGFNNNHYLCLSLLNEAREAKKSVYTGSYINIDKHFPELTKYLPLIQKEKEKLTIKRGNIIESWGNYADIKEDLEHINKFRLKCLNNMIKLTDKLINN